MNAFKYAKKVVAVIVFAGIISAIGFHLISPKDQPSNVVWSEK